MLPARTGTNDQPMANASQQKAAATSLLQYLMPKTSGPEIEKFHQQCSSRCKATSLFSNSVWNSIQVIKVSMKTQIIFTCSLHAAFYSTFTEIIQVLEGLFLLAYTSAQ